ncbi:MAG TPA: type II toxin-antitoxin system VapC family toxin, partial [Candidatus Binataceae bacterium]|nr:type II toxin-antitoxin system VapC family toxin [Candidatus Binataceae bacterium]
MALYFLETSALVKLYVWEPGTDRLLPLVNAGPENRFAVVTISAVEARSALRRRQRAGDIDQNTADTLLDALQKHLETLFVQQPINDAVLGRATEMIDRYPLRAYDAIQLAGCLVLRSIGPQ